MGAFKGTHLVPRTESIESWVARNHSRLNSIRSKFDRLSDFQSLSTNALERSQLVSSLNAAHMLLVGVENVLSSETERWGL